MALLIVAYRAKFLGREALQTLGYFLGAQLVVVPDGVARILQTLLGVGSRDIEELRVGV